MRRRLCSSILAVLVTLLSVDGLAQSDVYIPDDLKPWEDWVLEGKEYRDCPFFFNRGATNENEYICAWPGRMELSVNADGGRFNQRWAIYATEVWLPLPGDINAWPEQVTADGQPISVVARDGKPNIRLGPGQYNLSGRFVWDERPRTLNVPPQSGLLDLNVDGEVVVRPDRNGQSVWLGERDQESKVEDSLQVQVYRQVVDDVPIRLGTVLQIQSSGSVREELIGPVLPAGFTPLSIESDLPTRLEPDGNIRLQVRPGSWEVLLVARAAGFTDSIELQEPASNLPATEVWSYRSNDELRVTVPEGLAPVDPLQVGVPDDWEELPAYRIQVGETLSIVERSRGKVATDNQLNLYRQLWLDFNGDGFVFSDMINGTMRDVWRLDMNQPYGLFSATEDGENLLVTVVGDSDSAGIEIRQPNLNLGAVGRTESRGSMPVTGWQAQFNSVNTTLHLPPGNKLFAAPGADSAGTSWVNRWELLDFFLVLMASLAAARLFGRGIGLLTLAALVLSLHEPGAPKFVWLNLLIAVALVRVAPAGKLLLASKAYRNMSMLVVLMLFIPFAAEQLRIAIYPQLESQTSYGLFERMQARRDAELFGAGVPSDMGMQTQESSVRPSVRLEAPQADSLEEIVVTAQKARAFNRYAPNAIVQVGPGRPAWQWNSYQLSWSGPVDLERSVRLVIMPRWLVTGLRFLMVTLLGLLVANFAFDLFNRVPPWAGIDANRKTSGKLAGGTTAALILASIAFASPSTTHADTPSDSVLQQLEQRLLEPPACVPRCAEIIEAQVEVGAQAMTIRLTANALADVALPLPGSMQGWRPEQVSMDGVAASHVFRSSDQSLWIRTPTGRREIVLRGPLPPVDSLEIPFPTRPRVITVDAPDWFIAGIRERQLMSGSLQLTRLQEDADDDSTTRWETSRFPVFARVEREVDLDLDWRVTTTVFRVAPEQGAISMNIPLLSGESVVTEDFTVSEGEILVTMNPAQESVSWQSNLPRESPLTLEAPLDAPWKEVWGFAIGSVWHAIFAGVPESESSETALSYRVAQFYPRAGESLQLDIDRPTATTGDTMVFDAARVSSSVGERSVTTELGLDYRSTRGSQHDIRLPDNSEITSVVIDGAVAPLRAENGQLRLPILPGVHNVTVTWRLSEPVSFRSSVPRVDLGAGASNIDATLTMPPNRWVLASFGPKLGPSVLYWSELVVLIGFAFILGRMKLTPLRTHHWLLLGLGFSTFSWLALFFVVVWLLAIDVQRDWKKTLSRRKYNAVQVFVGLLSVFALMTIVASLPMGLLGSPDMHVVGNGSYGNVLRWFDDRTDALLPVAYVLSLPIWIYKVLILAWSLWLSFALLKWLPWVWRQFVADQLWKPRENLGSRTSDVV